MSEEMETTECSSIDNVDSDASNLSIAVSNALNTTFKKFEDMLVELISKQEALFEKLSKQNDLTKNETVAKVHLTMLHTHQYYKKLLQIKKDMMDLHGKLGKLVIKAKRLKENEEKEAENRRLKLHVMEQRERSLIAKPAAPAT